MADSTRTTTTRIAFVGSGGSLMLLEKQHREQRRSAPKPLFRLAKRRPRDGETNDNNSDKNNEGWYEAVDDHATPDDVFWGEMERQILLNGGDPSLMNNNNNNEGDDDGLGDTDTASATSLLVTASSSSSSAMLTGGTTTGSSSTSSTSSYSIHTINLSQAAAAVNNNNNSNNNNNKPVSPKMIEASLSEYAAFMVADNWLDDDMVERKLQREMMGLDNTNNNNNNNNDIDNEGDAFFRGVPSLDDQLDAWAATSDPNVNGDNNDMDKDDNYDDDDDEDYMPREDDEPWDQWSKAERDQRRYGQLNDDDDEEERKRNAMDVDRWFRRSNDKESRRSRSSSRSCSSSSTDTLNDKEEATVSSSDEDKADDRRQELADARRLAALSIRSSRLELARNNPKATAFFQRAPDATEGLDQMWVSAMDNVCFKNLVGTYRNYGIQFADNFGDWRDGCLPDGLATIEDVASYKARQVFAITGLPCIASRTSFEIEPVPTDMNGGTALSAAAAGQPRSASALFSNPRVVSGYRFNDIGMHVDYICDVLRPLSECDRVTRFKTCLCYFDGEMEIFEYGICDVDLHFSNSLRTFIPVAQAINEMLKTLELTFGLVYQKWLKARMNEVLSSGGTGVASVKLRDRVLKEGRVLPNDIIDVSAFMDSMVDVNLMDECAKELSQRFVSEKPTKILTVATTGLVVALPMAKYLQVPVVYARKERNVVMADTFIAAYSSKTVGKNRELLVSKSHIHADDRVLIVDDFLSSGSSQEALLRIVSQADATAVGIGCLLEKVYDSGRQSLSGFDVPIHSLCRIASVQSGVIQLMEEEGFDLMQKQNEQKKQQQNLLNP